MKTFSFRLRWKIFGGSFFSIFLVGLVLLVSSCTTSGPMQISGYGVPTATVQDAEFTLLSWNVHKSKHPDLPGDLQDVLHTYQPDLVFLQEAKPGMVEEPHLAGTLAPAWRHPLKLRSEVGVFTASCVEPLDRQAFRSKSRELGFTTPKTALMTRYALSNGTELLAVNVHALNFERGEPKRFIRQMQTLHRLMEVHEGPIVFAGDFNTWNQERNDYMLELAAGLGMQEVDSFVGDRKTGDHGWANHMLGIDPSLPLDRVFYRGLELTSAQILDLESSDHDPLVVRFRSLPNGKGDSALAMLEPDRGAGELTEEL
ncbi:endonuclease/exonuclease/phosphatase family protein [Kiritimatiellaeota bacterium B1221]|nr:endonuclease/exonuclease/phosphatase family protein [Kiritimatiellaeota bacterium B1221]